MVKIADFISIKKKKAALSPSLAGCPGIWQPQPSAQEWEPWLQAHMAYWHSEGEGRMGKGDREQDQGLGKERVALGIWEHPEHTLQGP